MSRDDIERLLKKLSEDPESKLFVPLAEAYRKAGMVEEAISTLVQGLEKQPHYLSARVSLGNIYMSQGLLNEARMEFEEVAASIPDNLYVHKKLAEIYRELGEKDKTRHELNTVLKLNPTDEWAISSLAAIEKDSREVSEIKIAVELERPELSSAPAEEIHESQGTDDVLQDMLPIGEETATDQPAAEDAALPESSGEKMSVTEQAILRAEDSIRQGNFGEAMESYRAILSEDPENREILQRVAELKVLMKMLGKDQGTHIMALEGFLEKVKRRRDEFFGST